MDAQNQNQIAVKLLWEKENNLLWDKEKNELKRVIAFSKNWY